MEASTHTDGADHMRLIERLAAELSADTRVRASWLAGSIARGEQDVYSDVDLLAAVRREDLQSFAADWPAAAGRIAPLVLLRQAADGYAIVFKQVTDSWLRFDVTVCPPEQLAGYYRSTVRPLFDRDGLGALLGDAPRSPAADPALIEALVTEFLRVLGLLPVVLRREEYVLAATGAAELRTMLIRLVRYDSVPQSRSGALRLESLLPPERAAVLRELPPVEATRESVIAAHRACAAAFLPIARSLAQRAAADWPGDLEQATRDHLRRRLGIELPLRAG